jgi:hypothetical protein
VIVDIVLGVGLVGVGVYCMVLRGKLYRSLGLRDDWRRRFEKMREVLGMR